ncbi:MAG: YggT family protein [Mesorhizobium sp.]|nr:MAG: YggT family protein [Mesorhizobium sp.]
MYAIFFVLHKAIVFYWYIVIAAAIFSWLYAFNVVNSRNQFVGMIGNMLYRLTEPALRPIRRFMPDLGGIDISPIVLLFILIFVDVLLNTTIQPVFGIGYISGIA